MIDLYDCEEKKMACGSCPRYENMENPKAGFPHFHSAWETGVCKKRRRQFPTASTRPYYWFLFFTLFQKGTIPEPWVGEMKVLIVVEENNS